MTTSPSDPADPIVTKMIRSLARGRLVLLLLAIAIPGCLHAVFERQARRLEALGDHGEVTTATVTGTSRDGSVGYAYEVNGQPYTWSVKASAVPSAVPTFPVIYLPEDPSLSRAGSDRARATAEARSNRGFAWKVDVGIFYFFAFNALICEVRLRRLRRTGKTEAGDPQAYRTRLVLTGFLLLPMLALVFGWHALDASARGESLAPVIAGSVLGLAVLLGTGFYLLRDGMTGVATRSARLLKWAVPLALGIAAIRAIVWLAGAP